MVAASTGSACRASACIRLSPPRSPSPSPLTYRTQPPSSGAAGPLPRSYLCLPTLTALVSPSPVRGSRRHDPARGEQPHHRGDARAQVRERGRRVSARPEEAELTLAKSRVVSSFPALEGRDREPGVAFRVSLAGWTWKATGRGEPKACDAWGEAETGMRKQREDRSKACQRTGDLWDVRAVEARSHVREPTVLRGKERGLCIFRHCSEPRETLLGKLD